MLKGAKVMTDHNRNDINDLWDHNRKNSDDISEIRSDITGVKTGLHNMQSMMERGLNDLSKQIQTNRLEIPMIPLAMLCVVLLGSFGTVIVFLTSNNSDALKNEIEIRVTDVVKDVNYIHFRMSEDDKREQIDALEKGETNKDIAAMKRDIERLYDENKIHNSLFLQGANRLASLEKFEILNISGD